MQDCQQSKARSWHRVCAVADKRCQGATETAVGTDGLLKEYDGWTSKFIPPHTTLVWQTTMIANFYHSMSPLLMETAAFGGYELVMEAYNLAVKHGYKLELRRFTLDFGRLIAVIGAQND
ncbi:MAG: S-adenosylmethionine:tRNA ribosyltransferase-isomerase [Hoylesella buccalis]